MATGSKKRSAGIALRLLTATALALTVLVMVVAGGINRTPGADSFPEEIASAAVSDGAHSMQQTPDSRRQDESMQRDRIPPQPPQPAQPAIEQPPPPPPAAPAQPTQPANSVNPASPPQAPAEPAEPSPPAEPRDKQDVKKGELIEAPKPIYPDEAKRQKIEGLVTVEIVIGEDGNVISARPRSGHELLQGAAKDAALKARFKPTLVNGKPAKASGAMTYNFELDEK